MVAMTVPEGCGNSPKILFVKDFIVATVSADRAFVERNTTDDIRWDLVGGQCISGKQDVLAELQRLRGDEVVGLSINTIVTHGYSGAANGVLQFRDGKTIAFCDIYQFRASTNNAPIKAITTYAIVLA